MAWELVAWPAEPRTRSAPLGARALRRRPAPARSLPVREPELEGRDAVLDHGRHVDRNLVDGPIGEAAAAGLVAREARAVDEEDGCSCAREAVGGGRAGRPGPDDDDVEALHPAESTLRLLATIRDRRGSTQVTKGDRL